MRDYQKDKQTQSAVPQPHHLKQIPSTESSDKPSLKPMPNASRMVPDHRVQGVAWAKTKYVSVSVTVCTT